MASGVLIRSLAPQDYGALKHLHDKIFPIDYDASFFERATTQNGIAGWAAVAPQRASQTERLPDAMDVFVGNEQLVGFVTGRMFDTREIPAADRRLLGFGSDHVDGKVVYILTLGVVPRFRHKGIAATLLKCLEEHARLHGCMAMYLHVISYNEAARQFYARARFSMVAELPGFYYIQ